MVLCVRVCANHLLRFTTSIADFRWDNVCNVWLRLWFRVVHYNNRFLNFGESPSCVSRVSNFVPQHVIVQINKIQFSKFKKNSHKLLISNFFIFRDLKKSWKVQAKGKRRNLDSKNVAQRYNYNVEKCTKFEQRNFVSRERLRSKLHTAILFGKHIDSSILSIPSCDKREIPFQNNGRSRCGNLSFLSSSKQNDYSRSADNDGSMDTSQLSDCRVPKYTIVYNVQKNFFLFSKQSLSH